MRVYADITGEWASSDESDVISWDAATAGRNRYWSVQLQTQDPLTEDTQMANWGSAIWGSPLAENQTYQSGYAADVRNQFASARSLTGANDTDFRASFMTTSPCSRSPATSARSAGTRGGR